MSHQIPTHYLPESICFGSGLYGACHAPVGYHGSMWVGDYTFDTCDVICSACKETDLYRNDLLAEELTR